MSTDRFAVGDHLTANFNAQSLWRAAGRRLPLHDTLCWDHALCSDPGAKLPRARLHRDWVDPQWLCAEFQWPRCDRHQERVGRALRPGAGGLYQCGAGAARPRRLGARLVGPRASFLIRTAVRAGPAPEIRSCGNVMEARSLRLSTEAATGVAMPRRSPMCGRNNPNKE